MNDIDKVWEVIVAVALAVTGGLARMLNSRTKVKITRILSEMFISAFAGLMILLLARGLGLSGDWLGLVCGMAGWIGPQILDVVANWCNKLLGLDKQLDEDNERADRILGINHNNQE